MRNLEIKAKLDGLDEARRRAEQCGALYQGVLIQKDTYFVCSTGRLKLRELGDGSSWLIGYQRPNASSIRASDYSMVAVESTIGPLLAGSLGIRCVVEKRRDLYLVENVRIHLDEVRGLGTFLEFETVLSPEHDATSSQRRLERLQAHFGITPAALIAGSYMDLLEQANDRTAEGD